jgi:hypothetical protein
MPLKNTSPSPKPLSHRPQLPKEPPAQTPPVEPTEVMGRHKNTGQKDHKGAR